MAKAKAVKVEGGTVSYSMGLTIPGAAQYSSNRIDCSMTLPILPGETPLAAHDRVQVELSNAFKGSIGDTSDLLNSLMTQQSTKNKTPGR